MHEKFDYYTTASSDSQIIRYLLAELKWKLAPPTGDCSSVMAHRGRFSHAIQLAQERGELLSLEGRDNAHMAEMANIIKMLGDFQRETDRLARLTIDPMKEAIKASYVENQNLHCFNLKRLPKKAVECIERQTDALRKVKERFNGIFSD